MAEREPTFVSVVESDQNLQRDPTEIYWEAFHGARNDSTASVMEQKHKEKADAEAWLDAKKNPKHQKTQMPKLATFLSIFFPPIGCIMYCLALDSPEGTPRCTWSRRALYFGCFLSCVYTFIAASALGSLRVNSPNDNVDTGIGFPYSVNSNWGAL